MTLSNESPSASALLDEWLATASPAQIYDHVMRISGILAADDPLRADNRALCQYFYDLWENGGDTTDAEGAVVHHDPRPTILDEAMAKKATKLAKNLKDAIADEEAAREPAKKPFLHGGKLIDGTFKDRAETLKPALTGMTQRLDIWQRAERLRLQRESEAAARAEQDRQAEARKLAAEAAANDPAAQARAAEAQRVADRAAQVAEDARREAMDKQRVRGAGGAMATQRTTQKVRLREGFTLNQVPAQFLILNEAAAKAALMAKQEVAGVELYDVTDTVIR